MHMGIRPSATIDKNGCFKDPAKGFFYNSLNVRYPRLLLPTVVVEAVVANVNKIPQCLIFCLLVCSIRQSAYSSSCQPALCLYK